MPCRSVSYCKIEGVGWVAAYWRLWVRTCEMGWCAFVCTWGGRCSLKSRDFRDPVMSSSSFMSHSGAAGVFGSSAQSSAGSSVCVHTGCVCVCVCVLFVGVCSCPTNQQDTAFSSKSVNNVVTVAGDENASNLRTCWEHIHTHPLTCCKWRSSACSAAASSAATSACCPPVCICAWYRYR